MLVYGASSRSQLTLLAVLWHCPIPYHLTVLLVAKHLLAEREGGWAGRWLLNEGSPPPLEGENCGPVEGLRAQFTTNLKNVTLLRSRSGLNPSWAFLF